MNGTVIFFTAKVKFLRPKILQLLLNADSAGFYADVLGLYICISGFGFVGTDSGDKCLCSLLVDTNADVLSTWPRLYKA